MANWALTNYCIEGKPEDLQQLFNLCEEFCTGKRPPMQKDADNSWEGNIVLALGEEIGENYIRGFINEYSLSDGVLRIDAAEAWGATNFRHILTRHYPGMKVYYIVEEGGDEVFATNDAEGKYFPYRFFLRYEINGDGGTEEFKTRREAMKYIANLFNRKSIKTSEVIEWNNAQVDADSDNCISLYEYKITKN